MCPEPRPCVNTPHTHTLPSACSRHGAWVRDGTSLPPIRGTGIQPCPASIPAVYLFIYFFPAVYLTLCARHCAKREGWAGTTPPGRTPAQLNAAGGCASEPQGPVVSHTSPVTSSRMPRMEHSLEWSYARPRAGPRQLPQCGGEAQAGTGGHKLALFGTRPERAWELEAAPGSGGAD